MLSALTRHWPEYLMEAAGLGIFMVSACLFDSLLEHPASPLRQAIADPLTRRALMGVAMGLTAVAIIYSPWGMQSGAHLNPAVTLSFLWLGKVGAWDGLFYILAQFAGGLAGIFLVSALFGPWVSHPSVKYVATIPGMDGPSVAFLAELVISFGLMLVVLITSNTERLARFTGLFAGGLVAAYITLEAPLSGMSMNPARTFASAVPAHALSPLWIYVIAPPLGMLLAAELYRLQAGSRGVRCAKLHHQNDKRCIFRCGYAATLTAHAGTAEMAPGDAAPARSPNDHREQSYSTPLPASHGEGIP
ncbi:MAG TPA: aquaporin [Candidatus Methylomirabilis sp.]|nr:aquaporin [Candidatus Methylomirabilis sp.]